MSLEQSSFVRPRVCAVSYLNTVPLVWGMLHGSPEDGRDVFDLEFELPSVCAERLASGQAQIGIVPVIEMARQNLEYFRGTGIACHGPVRSILLISKVPFRDIKKLAADSGSRTSVMLSRVILAEKFGVEPQIVSMTADLAPMLGMADAALLIGDAALRVDPEKLPFETLDLGAEWVSMTALPMVFALWSGRKEVMDPRYARAFIASCRFGREHLDDIVRSESPARHFPEPMVREYLTERIVFELGERDYQGLELFLQRAGRFEKIHIPGGVSA